jgi:hypothetical protein
MKATTCARPACPGQPAAWLAYDYEARCAWLDDAGATPAGGAHRWPLCERHADTLRVPRGWFCIDRRVVPPGAAAGAEPGAALTGALAEAVPERSGSALL